MPWQRPLENDESLMGFVLRMANSNEVRGIHWLYQRLGRNKLNRFKFEDCDAIALTFGASIENIQRVMWRRRFSHGAPIQTIDTIKITKPYLIRPLRPQLCPRCIEDNGYCRLVWDLQFVSACHVHKCALVDRCPLCHRYLQWMRPFLKHCNCGFPWNKLQTHEYTSDSPRVRLADIFQNKLRPAESNFSPQDPFEVTLSGLSIDAISKLIWIFGVKEKFDSHIGTGNSQKILRTEDASRCAERGYLRLKLFSCAALDKASTTLDPINLTGLKAFVLEADSDPDIRFAEWLAREIIRQSEGTYSLGTTGQRQHQLF